MEEIALIGRKEWNELRENIVNILTNTQKGLKIMGVLEDKIAGLQLSVTNLQTAVGTASQEISTLAAGIQANPADVQAVSDSATKIQAAADALNQAVQAAQTPPTPAA